mgnify:CR=1 FL=1
MIYDCTQIPLGEKFKGKRQIMRVHLKSTPPL